VQILIRVVQEVSPLIRNPIRVKSFLGIQRSCWCRSKHKGYRATPLTKTPLGFGAHTRRCGVDAGSILRQGRALLAKVVATTTGSDDERRRRRVATMNVADDGGAKAAASAEGEMRMRRRRKKGSEGKA